MGRKWLKFRYFLAADIPMPAADKAIVHIIDDDEDMRDYLAHVLQSENIETACHEGAEEFLAAFDLWSPGCVVLDLRLPDSCGLTVQNQLKSLRREIPILFISAFAEIPNVVDAMQNGAVGFISKPIDPEDFLKQVDHALTLDRAHLARTRDRLRALEHIAQLTPRELEVLEQVAAGHPNKVVAQILEISPKTVELHRASVMRKLKADSVADLVKIALLYL